MKPNLVEDLPGPVNTHPALITAAAQCFLSLGTRKVVVGGGPGDQRDTEAILMPTGLGRRSTSQACAGAFPGSATIRAQSQRTTLGINQLSGRARIRATHAVQFYLGVGADPTPGNKGIAGFRAKHNRNHRDEAWRRSCAASNFAAAIRLQRASGWSSPRSVSEID